MATRDEFNQRTKDILAKRTGYKCSFPSCWSNTIGPSNESTSPIDSTGMACHIYAAAPGKGAKRYKKDMTHEERKSENNGIWMCYKHGKQIDNDEERFTAEMLFQWKQIAETRAKIEHELGKSIVGDLSLLSIGLAKSEILIDISLVGHENDLVGNALIDANAEFLWGKDLINHVKIYLIEIIRNAIKHGLATNITLKIDTNKITLIDNGTKYYHSDLLKEKKLRGGAESYLEISNKYKNRILILSERIENKNYNTISFINEINDIKKISLCVYNFEPIYKRQDSNINSKIYETCSDVYILLHKHACLSDIHDLRKMKSEFEGIKKPLVFVLQDTIELLEIKIQNLFPDARVMHIKSDN